MNRHLCTRGCLVLAVLCAAVYANGAPAAEPLALPTTGLEVSQLAPFDRIMTELMREWKIPGGALAVARQGRLVLARGYGLADVEKQEPVEPDALLRIASLSKPITAAAVLVLVERGRLDLDAKVLDVLGPIQPLEGESVDPRWREITMRRLLQHTGGFDRSKSFDPMFRPSSIAKAVGVPRPADSQAIIRYMLGRPLDFRPGTRYAYSNFGYCLLGRVIEQVTGETYESAVQALVLRPAGITRMRLGRTQAADRADGEVRYDAPEGTQRVGSVFPDVQQPVPIPYGRFYLEAMDSHGGWIASAVDLVRFATFVDGSRRPGLFKPETIRWIESRPPPPVSVDAPTYYGLGWQIGPQDTGANWWHNGSLSGTNSLLLRNHEGLVWAAVFNSRPRGGLRFLEALDRGLWKAAGQVQKWPEHDLFGRYSSRPKTIRPALVCRTLVTAMVICSLM